MKWDSWFKRRRWERRMDAEFRFHLDTQINDYISQGLSRQEAELRARRDFGPVELAKEESRDQRPVKWLDSFLRDVRFACRSLRKRPGFAAAVVVTLALGIGANTAIFSIVRAVLLKPLPYSEPDRIVRLWMAAPQEGVSQLVFSGPNFTDVRDQSGAFRALAAHRGWPFIVTGSGEPVRAFGQRVSASLFEVFGISPLKGRAFTPAEDIEGKDSVAVISYHFWQHHFGGAADIVGRTVIVSDAPRTVIGVMPPDFQFPSPETDLWVPLAMTTGDRNRNLETLYVVGRLRDGVSLQQAQIEAKSIASRLATQFPGSNKGKTIRVVPFHEDLVQDVRRSLLVLEGAVIFVLLITCANVGALLLTRTAGRFKEFALRSSLGATRHRLVLQLLTESLLLATLGGVCGIVLGYWCRGLLIRMASPVPRIEQASLDPTVLAFALSVTAACALLVGIIPALQATKFDLAGAIKQGLGPFAGRSGLRSVLVVAEVSLAVVLLIGGVLMVRTLVKMNEIAPGFRTEGLLTFETFLSPNRYKMPGQLAGFYQQALERLQGIPGIRSAGLTNGVPLTDVGLFLSFEIVGRHKAEEQLVSSYRAISPGYLSAMGIPLLKGRDFTASDTSTSPGVALINGSFVKRYFPDGNPVGQFLEIGDGYNKPREIVGVIGDTKGKTLTGHVDPEVYVVCVQRPWQWSSYVVRAQAEPALLIPAVRTAIWGVDHDVPINDMRTMDELLSRQTAEPRLRSVLLGIFAGLAALLAALGVYSTIAYSVAARTHEIGIRMAIGATRGDVVKMVVKGGLFLIGLGITLGLVGSYWLTKSLAGLLYGISPNDALTFLVAPIGLTMVGALATLIPASRAAASSPTVALRCQ